MKTITTIALMLTWNFAVAAPVTWTLNDVTFADGSVATGQFTYDADTGFFTSSDIVVSIGNSSLYLVPEDLYSTAGVNNTADTHYFQGSPAVFAYNWGFDTDYFVFVYERLYFDFSSALTNAGGTVALSGNSFFGQQYQDQADCYFSYCEWHTEALVTGSVSAVPLPAAAWLLGSALGALIFRRKVMAI